MIRELLARYPLLGLLSPGQLDDWIAAGQERSVATGETVFQENTPGAWAYLALEGRVRILRQMGQREITLGALLPGDVFGEYALLPPGRNTATCRTSTPSRLLCLPLGPLRGALQGMKPVWKNLKNWLRLRTQLHFQRERAYLGFLSAESGLKFLDRLHPAFFPAGQTIQASGLAADCWYVIEKGKLRLQTDVGRGGGGIDLGPGESFGERALAGRDDLPMATALSSVRCQVLERHDFDPSAPAPSKVAQSYWPRLPDRPPEHVWAPQLELADCGLAALAMVSLRYGTHLNVEELRPKVSLGPKGLNVDQMLELAEEHGLPCRVVRVSVNRLDQVRLPAIAHLNDGHYVVLHELSESGVVIGDPAAGIVTWSIEFLGSCSSGALLLFDRPARR
jgi:CRP-like cAMP-binding protein